MKKKSLFLFRRDLRMEDNLGLTQALINSEIVIPCFIYDPVLLKNPNIGNFRWSFLNQSLKDLDYNLKSKKSTLQIFVGNPSKVIENIILQNKIDSVFCNIDFSEYSKKRDEKILQICRKYKVQFNQYLDFLLHNPNEIKTNEGSPYLVYTHFFKKAKQYPIRKILKNNHNNYFQESISYQKIRQSIKIDNGILGGREEGLRILKNLRNFQNYLNSKDFPIHNTTMISPHIKFGNISVREVFNAVRDKLGAHHSLINQIYWREFFNHIFYHYPDSQYKSFKKKYRNIVWAKNKKHFNFWKIGKTGFPIVDAGMRELNSTGFMHNRIRMIAASFLTKDLHIDWVWGERYFSQKLVDYDVAVNIGNWQWVASTGCDSVPYFRVFNPWRQQEKFDQECTYIKKWIPELSDLSPYQIHNLWKTRPSELNYPIPIVEHQIESIKSKEIFKKISD